MGECLRGTSAVSELIRNLPDVQALLTNDGYTADAARAFNHVIKALFELSSKFMHAVDKSGTHIVPEVRAQKKTRTFTSSRRWPL